MSDAPLTNIRLGYKLFRVTKDGGPGSLFIDRKRPLPVGQWLMAKDVPTAGYKHRPGWHVMEQPVAPHLSEAGREWYAVLYADVISTERRPASQGGIWHCAAFIYIVPRRIP